MMDDQLSLVHVDVRDLVHGQQVDQVLVVRDSEQRTKKDGGAYLKLILGDRTGSLETVAWDEVPRLTEEATVGALLRVQGKFEVHDKYGARLNLGERNKRVLARIATEGEYVLDRLLMGPQRPLREIEDDLRGLVASLQNHWLYAVADTLFHEQDPPSPFYEAFREAPAARRVHQAYRHGLIEHTVSVAQGVAARGHLVNRDLAVTGALVHDIGKVDVYTRDALAIDLTDAGKLHGEIPITYLRVRQVIDVIDEFPVSLADALLHIVVSHHGRLEWGSPVVPCTREASLVHAVDALEANLGSFDRLAGELPSGDRWTVYDRALGTRAWFGPDE